MIPDTPLRHSSKNSSKRTTESSFYIFRAILTIGALIFFTSPLMADEGKSFHDGFLSLDATVANMRTGPGLRYPIRWVYRRPGLPLRQLRQFNNWRKVRDWEGSTGWIHIALLSATNRAQIVGESAVALRSRPINSAGAVALVEPGVIGRPVSCTRQWCQIRVAGHNGWLRRKRIFGVPRRR